MLRTITTIGTGTFLAVGGIATIAALVYTLPGLAALADAQRVCPDGNQCSDALGMVSLSAGTLLTAIVFWVVIIARSKRASKRRQSAKSDSAPH